MIGPNRYSVDSKAIHNRLEAGLAMKAGSIQTMAIIHNDKVKYIGRGCHSERPDANRFLLHPKAGIDENLIPGSFPIVCRRSRHSSSCPVTGSQPPWQRTGNHQVSFVALVFAARSGRIGRLWKDPTAAALRIEFIEWKMPETNSVRLLSNGGTGGNQSRPPILQKRITSR